MPYRYLEEIATADVAFEAWGKNIEELFRTVCEATMNVMVDDLASINRQDRVTITLEQTDLDLLLFAFIAELIFLKDARRLLLLVEKISIGLTPEKYTLQAELCGETLDPTRHPLLVDVKAVTLHLFRLVQEEDDWRATVVLDI